MEVWKVHGLPQANFKIIIIIFDNSFTNLHSTCTVLKNTRLDELKKSSQVGDDSNIYNATDEVSGSASVFNYELFASIVGMIEDFPGEAYRYFVSNGQEYSHLPSDEVDDNSLEVINFLLLYFSYHVHPWRTDA